MTKAVVLLSGGLDSSVCLAMARHTFEASEVLAVNMQYGQKHAREKFAAREVAKHFGVHLTEVTLENFLFRGAGSTLIDPDAKTPEMTYEQMANAAPGVSPTYVPFRNGNLLSAATAFAISAGGATADDPVELFYGAHAEDARGFAYPDCTFEFNGAMAGAIFVGSYGAVRLVTPIQWCEKWQIVAIGAQIQDFPFALTYSCYNGGETHCGVCPTCIGRRMAFLRAGVPDPTPYLSTPADMPSPEQVRPDLHPNT